VDPYIVIFGLAVGILVGMTGIGGGSLMTPLLILIFGVKPVTAIGTDLAYAAVTKTVGGWRHLRQGTVALSLSTWMALGSVPASIGGVYALQALERAAGRRFDSLLLALLAGRSCSPASSRWRARSSSRASTSASARASRSTGGTSSPR